MSAFEAPHNTEVEKTEEKPHVPNVIKTQVTFEEEEERIEEEERKEKIDMILARKHKKYSVAEFMSHAASKHQVLNLLVDRGK